MINPYFIYILAFSIALGTYQLNWSSLYPALDISLISFLMVTFIVSLVIGKRFIKTSLLRYYNISCSTQINKICLFLACSWIAEFSYCKTIPLLQIVSGSQYNSVDFGVPSFHVFVYTLNSFFSTYLFHNYLSNRNSKNLRIYLLSFLPFILLASRGGLLMNAISSVFVWLLFKAVSIKLFSMIKIFIVSLVLSIVVLYSFGVLGNIRTAAIYESEDQEIILSIGKANPDYVSSAIPKEFFWAYLYISSPLANLQQNINLHNISNLSLVDFTRFFINETLPDFISKRINQIFESEAYTYFQITDELTVCTVYAASFVYLSWIGMVMMAFIILIFPLIYVSKLSNDNPLRLTGIATMNTLYLFLIFDNMFVDSGLGLQLMYPLLMPHFLGIKAIKLPVSAQK